MTREESEGEDRSMTRSVKEGTVHKGGSAFYLHRQSPLAHGVERSILAQGVVAGQMRRNTRMAELSGAWKPRAGIVLGETGRLRAGSVWPIGVPFWASTTDAGFLTKSNRRSLLGP